MDLNNMSLDELKTYAKTLDIKVGNIGKDKLIEKIKKAETNKSSDVKPVDTKLSDDQSPISSIIDDDDLEEQESIPVVSSKPEKSVVESITSVIDDLDEYGDGEDYAVVDLPMDTVIETKSITMGGLTYKARSNNALFRWDHIGATQTMTIAELNEMNNHKRDFLNKPLIILKDERAMRKFRLTSLYENVAKISNLKSVFASDMNTIEKTIDTAIDVNMRDILVSKVSHMIKNKALVDINVIHLLSKKLNYDFEDILTQEQ